MKEILYFWMDLLEEGILAYLLIWLFKDLLPERFCEKGRLKSHQMMWLCFVGVRMIFSHLEWVKQLLYGNEMYIADSRQSILPVAVSMAVTLLTGAAVYRGSRMKLISLVTAFYAMFELSRFTFYPLAVNSIDFVAEYYNRLCWEENKITIEQYQRLMGQIEIVWNVLVSAVLIVTLMFCVRRYKRDLMRGEMFGGSKKENFYRHREAALIFVPGLLGLVFTTMLRTILFYYNREMYSLIQNYPELNLIIPILSLLCIVSILLSVKLLGELNLEHEKRRQAELYQSRVRELEAHVGDMESVNIQIRGMRHDMKNYIADINALLAQTASGDKEAAKEVRRYVDSMQASLESLEMKYQTKNPVTDVIVGRYVRLARQQKISFSSDFIYPHHLGIDVFDMSIILNNGLENAFEACGREEEGAFVTLSAKAKGNMFLLVIENRFTGSLKWDGAFPVSEKTEAGHGLGFWNMKNCAEKYYGKIDVRTDETTFCLTVMLQGNRGFDDKK